MGTGEHVGQEHATFTALMFGHDGGMEAECSMFVKELANKLKLSKMRNAELKDHFPVISPSVCQRLKDTVV